MPKAINASSNYTTMTPVASNKLNSNTTKQLNITRILVKTTERFQLILQYKLKTTADKQQKKFNHYQMHNENYLLIVSTRLTVLFVQFVKTLFYTSAELYKTSSNALPVQHGQTSVFDFVTSCNSFYLPLQ